MTFVALFVLPARMAGSTEAPSFSTGFVLCVRALAGRPVPLTQHSVGKTLHSQVCKGGTHSHSNALPSWAESQFEKNCEFQLCELFLILEQLFAKMLV